METGNWKLVRYARPRRQFALVLRAGSSRYPVGTGRPAFLPEMTALRDIKGGVLG
jgi:hypothetical protein